MVGRVTSRTHCCFVAYICRELGRFIQLIKNARNRSGELHYITIKLLT